MVRNQVRVQVRYEIVPKYIVIALEIRHKGQLQQKSYDQVNWL